jgi:hypothetical protein
MIYYALRSSASYLGRLQQIARSEDDHQILSVVGGLAFLHAIGAKTKRLCLIDVDKDALPYCRLVLRLIAMSSSARDLLSLLTNRVVSETNWIDRPLGPPLDRSAEIARGLGDADLERLYAKSYGAMELDPETGIARLGRNTIIRFFGSDLTTWVYSWSFGENNLVDDGRYATLKRTLASIPVDLRLASFETVDYAEWTSPDDPPLYALVSNCDGPQFTFRDSILRRMQATARNPIRYRSWVRNCDVLPAESETIAKPIAPLVRNAEVDEVAPFGGNGSPALEIDAAEHRRFATVRALRDALPYERDVLLYRGSWSRWTRERARRAQIEELLQIAAPNYRWLVFCDSRKHASPARYLEWLEAGGLAHGYRVELIQWAADGFVLAWRRREDPTPSDAC